MTTNNIFILSDAIQSGKTSALQLLCNSQTSVAGFLTPDINQLRMFVDIEKNESFAFQKTIADKIDDVIIGKFIFDNAVFNKAHSILAQLHSTSNDIIIIDEIGKLELADKGFEPALHLFIEKINSITNKTIVLVIRDYLLEKCIAKYSIQHATILNVQQFKNHFDL
jgi:nucleoside-triphosphatase THEP1